MVAVLFCRTTFKMSVGGRAVTVVVEGPVTAGAS
jgi:hypothetical protein